MKTARNVGWTVVSAAVLWAALPKPPHETALESLKAHAYFAGHLLGWLPALKEQVILTSAGLPRGSPGMRPANGSITEVQGWVDKETFHAKYLYTGPMVFRNAATQQNGFDLECLTGTDRPFKEVLAEKIGKRKFRAFTDSYDDGSAKHVTIQEYEELAQKATNNASAPLPYPRAFAQSAFGDCRPVPEKMLEKYHGPFSSAAMLPDGNKALVFYSANKGTTTKMHMDVSDSLVTQVYGRKKWTFADPNYATTMALFGEKMNLFYTTGIDVHHEAAPPEVPMREVIAYPGDILYFPSMTLHSVTNLDDVTMGVDQPSADVYGALKRHWLCAICTFLNPFMIVKTIRQALTTGSINGHEVFFDEEVFSAKSKKD